MGEIDEIMSRNMEGFLQRVRSDQPPVFLEGALIVDGGPSGLATAAALKVRGVPSTIIERDDCIASLWKKYTYDRLHLHTPKRFCALPHFPFPESYPEYPSRDQVIAYLESYAAHFELKPLFRHNVISATYMRTFGHWDVVVCDVNDKSRVLHFVAKWLVVASGENANPFRPRFPGSDQFLGQIIHSSQYKNGRQYRGQRVLVVGGGNSGMEIALDLANHGADPSLAIRSEVHVLPRDILGMSTFALTVGLLGAKVPVWVVDRMLTFCSWLVHGNLAKLGLPQPKRGPMDLKLSIGKTPVLDVGAVRMIKKGRIQVLPGVEGFSHFRATFTNGQDLPFHSVIMATGYRSNICSWLQGGSELFDSSGYSKQAYPNGWKASNGLFAAGLTKRGFQGAISDAQNIAEYIHNQRSEL